MKFFFSPMYLAFANDILSLYITYYDRLLGNIIIFENVESA